MGKTNGQGIEALAVRRAAMADADKVRYRVYTSPTEFIAVIAESALMAMRVAGVAEPLRIVRDLPSEGVAIAAERMEAVDHTQRVSLPTEKVVKNRGVVEAPKNAEPLNANFIPLQLGDLDQKRPRAVRILTAKDWENMMGHTPAPEPAAMPQAVEMEVSETVPEPEQLPAAEDSNVLSPEQVQALLSE